MFWLPAGPLTIPSLSDRCVEYTRVGRGSRRCRPGAKIGDSAPPHFRVSVSCAPLTADRVAPPQTRGERRGVAADSLPPGSQGDQDLSCHFRPQGRFRSASRFRSACRFWPAGRFRIWLVEYSAPHARAQPFGVTGALCAGRSECNCERPAHTYQENTVSLPLARFSDTILLFAYT